MREAGKIRTGAFRKPSTVTDNVFPTAGFSAGATHQKTTEKWLYGSHFDPTS